MNRKKALEGVQFSRGSPELFGPKAPILYTDVFLATTENIC